MIGTNRNINYDEIVSIVAVGEVDVYDFQIPKNKCFFADGVLTHNSDTCLTLQWIVEEGKYMIDVEKQRHGEVGKLRVKFLPQYSLFEDFIEMPRDFHDEK